MLCYVIIIFCDGEILYKGIICPIIDLSCCIIVTWKFSTTSQWFAPYHRVCLENDQKTKRSVTAVLAFNVKYCFLRLACYRITYCTLQFIKKLPYSWLNCLFAVQMMSWGQFPMSDDERKQLQFIPPFSWVWW